MDCFWWRTCCCMCGEPFFKSCKSKSFLNYGFVGFTARGHFVNIKEMSYGKEERDVKDIIRR